MAIVIPNAYKQEIAEIISNQGSPENLVLKLFQNNLTPTTGSAAGDFTEADFTGYSGVNLIAANWDVAAGDTTVTTYNTAIVFESSAGSQSQNIYGYYIVGANSGDLKWAERFTDGPYTIVNNDDSVSVLLRFNLTGI